eukprot:scaffold63334_cov13-Prasinocladus_malaysianus.AAC.1
MGQTRIKYARTQHTSARTITLLALRVTLSPLKLSSLPPGHVCSYRTAVPVHSCNRPFPH